MKKSLLLATISLVWSFNIFGQVGMEVEGYIKIVDGNEGDSKVLTSDANGKASWQPSNNGVTIYAVGDFAQGGVVFWVSPNGQHGKVVSIYDTPAVNGWGLNAAYLIGADSNINGTGNTVAIATDNNRRSTHAAVLCAGLAYSGYDDWYLPAKDELNLIYQNKTTINSTATVNGGEVFANDSYWSSTEAGFKIGWVQNFVNGNQVIPTTYLHKVRAIRAF